MLVDKLKMYLASRCLSSIFDSAHAMVPSACAIFKALSVLLMGGNTVTSAIQPRPWSAQSPPGHIGKVR